MSLSSSQLLHPGAASAGGRLKQMQEAKEMERAVLAKAKRSGQPAPSYDLLELIGKGSFGRVFKSRRQSDHAVVAVKIIDVDNSDYKLDASEKDQAIKDFINEIKVLHTLKDSKAKNINLIHEAFPFHSQLWIVSEYCPGGSVHTLMKSSNPPGLEEKYIVAIARELAIAIKHVHEAGIIHRDVKAANILITQEGQLQLCDFGVSGILESKVAKRSTIIGTPFWMAPEMHESDALSNGYGTEIDCWAYGCTMYELATGLPPNARIAPHKLHLFLKKAPRLEGEEYSNELRDFVSFCLEERPENRPTAEGILKHPFIANSAKRYPTTLLRQLIERYAQWEQAGGQRTSLFNAYGAQGPSMDQLDEDDSWNFSTTDDFARSILRRFESPDAEPSAELQETTPKQSLSVLDRARHEERITRAERKMGRLFDMTAEPYGYTRRGSEPLSDLPLRSLHSNSANRETIIDLDEAQDLTYVQSLDLADVPTIRANRVNRFYEDDDDEQEDTTNEAPFLSERNFTKRLTKDWKYPTQMTMPERENARPRTQDWTFPKFQKDELESQSADEALLPPSSASKLAPPFRPTLKHTKTEPVGQFGDYLHPVGPAVLSSEPPDRTSMIDIDDPYLSSTSESAYTDVTSGDPFDLEPDVNTVRQSTAHHTYTHSAPSSEATLDNVELIHKRDDSFSSDSEVERAAKYASAGGPASVRESAASLRRASDADEWESDTLNSTDGNAQARHNDAPFDMAGVTPNWAFDSPTLGRDSDLSGFSPQSQRSDRDARQHQYAANGVGSSTASHLSFRAHRERSTRPDHNPHDLRRTATTIESSLHHHAASSTRSSRRSNHHHNQRVGRSHTHHHHRLPSNRQHHPSSHYQHRGASDDSSSSTAFATFPDPIPADPAALDEDAEPSVVVAELERLLDDYLAGLKAAGGYLGGVERHGWTTYAGDEGVGVE